MTNLRSEKANGDEKLLDLKKIQAIVLKNWLVLKRDVLRLVPLMIFPVLMITIFGYATTGTPHGLPAALVDYDNSPASANVVEALHEVNAISIRYEVGTESEAKRLMDDGSIKAMIIIPQGFGKALETGESQTKITVKVDESDSSVAQIVKGVIQQRIIAYSQSQAAAKLSQIQSRQDAAARALAQGSGTLNSLSQAFLEDSSLKTDEKTLRYIASILQTDLRQTLAQEIALKNTVGVTQSVDIYKTGNVTQGHQQITSPSYGSTIPAIAQLDLRMANDLKALASVNQLLASNARLAASNGASASTTGAAASSLESAASSLQPVQVDVVLSPVVFDPEPAYGQGRTNVDFLLPSIIALVIFQGATMGMGRALAGEKKDGSLTRVFLTPTSNVTILTGTMLFYMLFESIRSSFLVFLAMVLFGVTLKGSILVTLFIIMIFASGSVAIGLLISAITNSQEQYLSIAMLVSLPSMFLSGVFFPIQTMPSVLQGIANILPLNYAAIALRGVMIKGFDLATVMPQVIILLVFAVAFTGLALLVFKREIV